MGFRSLLTLIAVWSVLTGIMAPATLAAELDPPVITAQTSSINAVVADDFTMLSVTVTGRAPFHYQWLHNGVPYNGGPDTSTFIVTMTVANSGVYRCVVTNADGAATSEPMILNFVPHSMIKQRSQRVLASENDFISFLADVFTNHPVLKYEWQFNGRKIPEEVANPQDNELFLSQMTLASAGTYRLLAGTIAGTLISDNVTMAVVEGGERTVVAAAGKPVTLTARTAGPGLSYLWKRDDGQPLDPARVTGINTASLKIAKPDKAKDATYYYCEVRMSDVATPVTTGLILLMVESEKPVIYGVEFYDGAVAESYWDDRLYASHSPTRFNVSGLPAGLHCDPLTGRIFGTPAEGGIFNIKVSATNPVGTSAVTTATLTIARLDRTAVGTYTGFVVDGTGYFAALGITVGESGRFTGKGTTTSDSGHLTTFLFTGQLLTDGLEGLTGDSTPFKLPALDADSGIRDCYLTLEWRSGPGLLATLYVSDNITSYLYDTTPLNRNPWNARTNPASDSAGYYTVAMVQDGGTTTASGAGYASFTVTTGGTFTYAGRLPDGSAFAIPAFIDWDGNSTFLAWMYRYRGRLAASLTVGRGTPPLNMESDVQGTVSWHRPAGTLKALEYVYNEYFNGIDRKLTVQGGRYLRPNLPHITGPYMMDVLSGGRENIQMTGDSVLGGGYSGFAFAALNTRHAARFTSVQDPHNALHFTSLAFNAATGGFSGTATYTVRSDDATTVLGSYPITFQGIIARRNRYETQGFGMGYYARLFPYSVYNPDPEITKPLQQFNALYSGEIRIEPN